MKKPKWTAKEMITALKEAQGMIYVAARKLGCDPKTVYNYAKRHQSVQDAINNERGEFVDTCELALKRAVLAGEGWAVCFALKTLGKSRGYVERVDLRVERKNLDDMSVEELEEYERELERRIGTGSRS
jgi:hypothetical protein